MMPLSYRLRRMGYQTRIFWHCPWTGNLDGKAERLKQLSCDRADSDALHFVGHSLGGFVILHMFARYVPANLGRSVTLGTPHMGSVAARRIRRVPLLRSLPGRALNEAFALAPLPLPYDCELGTVAGKLNLLLGNLLGMGKPNDTLVVASEAKHPDAMQHVVFPVSHGTILLSSRVARHIERFLSEGTFGV